MGNLGEHVGTHWELDGNTLGIGKNIAPLPKKKNETLERMFNLPIGCMKFLLQKC
jgi:hypothetical protein